MLAGLLPLVSEAGNTEDFCTLATPEGSGFRCKVVHYDEGSPPTLMIKQYTRSSDDEKRKAKARLAMNQLVETHFREGGGGVKIRFVGKNGAWYQQSCTRISRTYKPFCYDPEKTKSENE
jgi:hypothetical protein